MSGSSDINETSELTIYREYLKNRFPDPVSSAKDVHYILGIATEETSLDQGTGVFSWIYPVGLSPEMVKDIKDKHHNVKVILSIGGDKKNPFKPIDDKEKWVYSAVKSIKDIIHPYNNTIDGIDINYEVINSTQKDDFSSYIGDLLKQLKTDIPAFKVLSIAPSKDNDSFYYNLYSSNKSRINLVDYQLYREKIFNIDDGLKIIKNRVEEYAPTIVLPGINTPSDPTIRDVIQIFLRKPNSFQGFFVWSDDGST